MGSFENEALENEDRSAKLPNLENEALKSRKRSKAKVETCLHFKNTRHCQVTMLIQQESSTITGRMQFKTIQVELRGVANALPPP